jgi:hypothetical protein
MLVIDALTLRRGTDNNLADINIGRLLDHERDGVGAIGPSLTALHARRVRSPERRSS